MRKLISVLSFFIYPFLSFSQTGISDNFNDNSLAAGWAANAQYALTETAAELRVVANKTAYDNFEFSFASINLSANPTVTIKIKSAAAFTLRIDLGDSGGRYTNATPTSVSVVAGAVYNTYTFNFSGKFNQSFPSAATVDATQITKLSFFFNPGANFSGTVYFEDLVVGVGGPTDGGGGTPLSILSTDIRLNQIGFYTNCNKIAIVKNVATDGTQFFIKPPDETATLFTGTLTVSANWSFSNENVRVADFSSFNTPGDYVLVVSGLGRSYPFTIGQRVHLPVNKASLKSYYYQRCGTDLLAAQAGTYARAEGHITEDNNAVIHNSAATGPRPQGTILASPKGWYDAGDYNKYIVNSGISTYTLLAAYEHYPAYYDTLNMNIPESGNGIPDILDEIKWNLDWMLTMQDPNDGGVYHKLTNANFDGIIMPNAATATRYFCKKATAATFDFAAVMATAYRIYKTSNLAFANQCLTAAQNAYNWGIANPGITFTNPGAGGGHPAIVTGEYGDGTLTDEREWAATELYIATLNDTYYGNSFKNTTWYGVPAWPNVNTLGLISLIHHRKNLTAMGYADTTNMKNKLFGIADPLRTQANSTSAYRVPMGTGGNNDFVWGSNGHASNQGMMLMQAYRLTNDATYFTAAVSALDYLNGRNATTYAFVTGYGDKTPMRPHHRPSEADGIVNPIPGFLAGGPNTDALGDCGAATYPSSTLKALAYQDAWCSYSTNEIAINWNAPYTYLSGAVEAVNPCSGGVLPVEFFSFSASKENKKVKLYWITSGEKSNDYFIIERSSDGKSFFSIGKVKGSGSSNSYIDYTFYDGKPLNEISYYRIAQVDFDETKTYSRIISVEFPNTEIFLYPNPTSGEFTVEYFDELNGEISIEDVVGKNILKEKVNVSGSFTRTYNLSNLPKGIYILSVNSERGKFIRKIILQ